MKIKLKGIVSDLRSVNNESLTFVVTELSTHRFSDRCFKVYCNTSVQFAKRLSNILDNGNTVAITVKCDLITSSNYAAIGTVTALRKLCVPN